MTKKRELLASVAPEPVKPQRRKGKGYALGERPAKSVPVGALWLTSNQMCDRYGGKSKMWLWNKVKNDPDFPKPRYQGRIQLYSVAEADEYDRKLLTSKTRKVA